MPSMVFDFERPLVALEEEISALQAQAAQDPSLEPRIKELQARLDAERREVYGKLTPWQRVQLARHMDRPRSSDFVKALITEFQEVHGDRGFADDQAVICGYGRFHGRPVAIVAQTKGKDVRENLRRNFGMMHPEGYRKAMRIMQSASKFCMPVLIFVDTPGAYPGIGAEERGQAEAIARNIRDMFTLEVPVIVTVVGEGASGGALGIGIGDRVLMLENAWYCVISPEGCAAILWRDRAMASKAAEALKLTAPDLIQLKVVDDIIPEPGGGAHRSPQSAYEQTAIAIQKHLDELSALGLEQLMQQRCAKYREMGVYIENGVHKGAALV